LERGKAHRISLRKGDCLELIKDIPDESIDLIITDCPYHIVTGGCTNIPKKSAMKERVFLQETSKTGKLFNHNDIKFSEWLPEAYRVLKDGSHIYIYINARNLKELQQEAEKVGFVFQNILIWEKGNATPNRYYLNAYEMILMLRKGKAKNINNMGTKNILKVNNIRNKNHPTEKPIELNEILIENSSKENETVLDMFMGTGSSGIACFNLNRNYIGMEIDEKYFNIARQRIERGE